MAVPGFDGQKMAVPGFDGFGMADLTGRKWLSLASGRLRAGFGLKMAVPGFRFGLKMAVPGFLASSWLR